MVVVGELKVTAPVVFKTVSVVEPVTAKVPVAVKLPLTVRPAKVGVDVVVRFWFNDELPNIVNMLELP